MRVSAIKVGNKSVNTGFTPGWYKVNDFATGQSGQVSMNELLTTVQADSSMMGLRARIAAFAIVQKSGLYALPGPGGTPVVCTTQQRACYTGLNITQPNLKAPYTDKSRSLAEWQIRSRALNPVCDMLKREHPLFQNGITDELKQSTLTFPAGFQDVYGRSSLWNQTAADFNGSKDLVYRNDGTKGWETECGIVICQDPGGRVDEWQDITVIPACAFSGNGFSTDNIPLELCTDKDSPWTFQLNKIEINGKNANALFNGNPVLSDPATASLWVYLTFVPDSANWVYGVLYQHVDMPVGGNGFNLDAHYYHHIAVYPEFRSTTVNVGGLATPIEYDNFFTLATQADIRQFVDKNQTFPLVRESSYQKMIDSINSLSRRLSCNPEILFNIQGATSTLRGNKPGEIPMGNPYNFMSGKSTEFPIFPIAFNSLAAKGFPTGFMAVPTSGTEMKIQVENVTLSASQLARMKATYVSEKYDIDKMTLQAAAQYGVARYSEKLPLASFSPCVLSNTGKDSVVAPLVPNMAVNPA